MVNVLFRWWLFGWLCVMSSFASAGGVKIELLSADNDINDQASLQRGAQIYAQQCLACHSLQYMRYNRVAKDLGWTDEEVEKLVALGRGKSVDMMFATLNPTLAATHLGAEPPDLSLMARLKGSDYIFTFLQAFEYESTNGNSNYYDVDSEGQWNNRVLPGTAMPNVLHHQKNHLTAEAFDNYVRDVVNFLDYVGEPAKRERETLGKSVILYLLVLLLFTYLLKREYWKDVK